MHPPAHPDPRRPQLDDYCNQVVADLTRRLSVLAEQRRQADAGHDFLVQTPHPALLDPLGWRE